MRSDSGCTRRELLCTVSVAIGGITGCNALKDTDQATTQSPPSGTTTPSSTAQFTGRSTTQWRSFRRDPRNTGCARRERGPTDDPAPKWTLSTDGGVWGSPAVADGTVYIGSMDGTLYAIDAKTGESVWTYSTGGPVQSTPAVVDGRVYVGSLDKHVYCLDAQTGEKRWAYETAGLVHSSPTVDGGTLYIGSGAAAVGEVYAFLESSDVEQEGGGVYALDAGTGELQWRRLPKSRISSTPAVVDRAVYIGTHSIGVENPLIVSFDTADGKTRWRYQADGAVPTSPTVHADTVYVASFPGTVYALETDTGTPKWTFDPGPGDIRGSTAVCDDSVYVPVSGNEPKNDNPVVYALSLDGDEQWATEIWGARQLGSSPAVTDEAIYIGTHHRTGNGGMYGLGLDGERLWIHSIRTGEGVGSSPAVVDGNLYFGADNDNVYAME